MAATRTSCRAGSAAIAVAAALGAVAPGAQAGQVTVVDGDRVERIEDPSVPTRAEIAFGPAPAHPAAAPPVASASSPGAVARALRRAYRKRAITLGVYRSHRRTYARARSTAGRLRGARRRELSYVVRSVERIAAAGRLQASRMPALFLQLRRNTAYWPSKRFPASGDQLTFRGSELLYQYFPGQGLQLHPLSNAKKANQLHGACTKAGRPGKPVCGARPPGPKPGTPCRPERLRRLLDEMTAMAVKRGKRFIAWEYNFDFGGGSPPWMSGMAQATAITAFARGTQLLKQPAYTATAAAALGAFETRRPTGVRTRGPTGGVHYLQYSFAPRLFVFNAFFQSLIGLYDYGRLAKDPRATALFNQAEPEARREVPLSSVGDWSRYSYGGTESTHEYHDLLREVLLGLGRRLGPLTSGAVYCAQATRYRGFQIDPPRIKFRGPASAIRRRPVRMRFGLSKLSVVQLQVFKGRKRVFTHLATYRRGNHAVGWRPKSAGAYRVRIAAKELRTGRGRRGRIAVTVPVR